MFEMKYQKWAFTLDVHAKTGDHYKIPNSWSAFQEFWKLLDAFIHMKEKNNEWMDGWWKKIHATICIKLINEDKSSTHDGDTNT